MAKQKLGPLQRKWIKALRSGKYKRTEGYLRSVTVRDGKIAKQSFCCLGVYCDVIGVRHRSIDLSWDQTVHPAYGSAQYGRDDILPIKTARDLGLRDESGARDDGNDDFSLAGLNDSGWSFKRLANLLERGPSRYFKRSA